MPSRRSRSVAGIAVISHGSSTREDRHGWVVPDLCCLAALSATWPPTLSGSSRCSSARSRYPSRSQGLATLTELRERARRARARARRPRPAVGHVVRRRSRGRSASRARPRTAATATSPPPPPAKPTLSPEARAALIRAREEATRHGSISIDSTHLLLAIAAPARSALDVEAARRSFGPPAINASAPTGLHPALHARLTRDRGPLGLDHLVRAALEDPDGQRLLDRLGVPPQQLLDAL